MIIYEQGLFGLASLLRVHGSAVYKVLFPAAFSTGIVLIFWGTGMPEYKWELYFHPYAIGAIVGFFSLMLTFRLNFCYGRYWEGATVVTQMLSKWMDFALLTAAFHYQSNQYDDIKPPSFGEHPDANQDNVVRRDCDFRPPSMDETKKAIAEALEEEEAQSKETIAWYRPLQRKRRGKRLERMSARDFEAKHEAKNISKSIDSSKDSALRSSDASIPIPLRFQERFAANLVAEGTPQERRQLLRKSRMGKAGLNIMGSKARVPTPSLFLQEMAHLCSLLSAVAMATLRNDIEEAESPIMEYVPGQPWPPADPDALSRDIKHEYGGESAVCVVAYFCLGLGRSERRRTLYNAARPFRVLGGVSDEEIRLLQAARGPYAKVALCEMWLKEFLSREYLSGSTGKVHGPVLSRLYQIISDGALGYHQARKIAYVPFPFPHGQITAFFSIVIVGLFPTLYYTYVSNTALACIMNFLSVLCFLGLYEVARELENPFSNIPNDIPLTTYQAQFNEALVTIYAGYNPDQWWQYGKAKKQASVTFDDDSGGDKNKGTPQKQNTVMFAVDNDNKKPVKEVEKGEETKEVDKGEEVKEVERGEVDEETKQEEVSNETEKQEEVSEGEKGGLTHGADTVGVAQEAEKGQVVQEAGKGEVAREIEKGEVVDQKAGTEGVVQEAEKGEIAQEANTDGKVAQEKEEGEVVQQAEKGEVAKEADKEGVAQEGEKEEVAQEAEKGQVVPDAEQREVVEDAEKGEAGQEGEREAEGVDEFARSTGPGDSNNQVSGLQPAATAKEGTGKEP